MTSKSLFTTKVFRPVLYKGNEDDLYSDAPGRPGFFESIENLSDGNFAMITDQETGVVEQICLDETFFRIQFTDFDKNPPSRPSETVLYKYEIDPVKSGFLYGTFYSHRDNEYVLLEDEETGELINLWLNYLVDEDEAYLYG
jgi:hypothetical protein